MNLLTEQSTMAETIVQNSTTAILTSIFYQALADSIIWLVVAAVVIVCDLFFGCEAARKRGERVRISRAVRRTVNKMCEYLCWVMLGITISIGFAADWLKYLIFAIIYGNELSSCLSNYFAAKGKRITFNVFSLLGRRLGIDELEQCHIEEDDRNKKNTANIDDSITYKNHVNYGRCAKTRSVHPIVGRRICERPRRCGRSNQQRNNDCNVAAARMR